jgi:hypothetical protein
MKKMIMTLAVALSTLFAFAGEENVNAKVLDAFNEQFNSAKEVKWTQGSNFYKAAFVFNGQHVFAFYTTEGELMGLTRYISSVDLPVRLQADLKKDYSNYWIADLFEVSNDEGTNYYMTIENADSRIILKSDSNNDWSTYQKFSKS